MDRLKLAGVILIIVLCIMLSGLLLFQKHMWELSSTPHKPKFLAGQCFNKTGLHEPWDLAVAGRVILHGYTKYLVMYADEANRVSGGDKTGWEEDIKTFDAKYQPTPCPETWMKHTTK